MYQSLEVVEDITNTQLGRKCKAYIRVVAENGTIGSVRHGKLTIGRLRIRWKDRLKEDEEN